MKPAFVVAPVAALLFASGIFYGGEQLGEKVGIASIPHAPADVQDVLDRLAAFVGTDMDQNNYASVTFYANDKPFVVIRAETNASSFMGTGHTLDQAMEMLRGSSDKLSRVVAPGT